MTAVLCEGHRPQADPCADCAVISDAFEERGVVVPESLLAGRANNPQEWSLRDLEEVALDIDNGSDEPNFTWILKIAGRWAAVRGWHDYTGWGCRSGLQTEWYESKEAAFRTLVDWEREIIGSVGAS